MKVEISGIDDVDKLLKKIAPNEAVNLMRATVHGMATETAKKAKSEMPSGRGIMKRATKVKRRRATFGVIASDIIVTKAAFYWRFREYGQGPDGREDAMFLKASEWLRSNKDNILIQQFGKKLEARLARLRKSGK